MKDEHKVFLERVLIPLHKAHSLSLFHPQVNNRVFVRACLIGFRLVNLLRRSIHWERAATSGSGDQGPSQILAKNVFDERSESEAIRACSSLTSIVDLISQRIGRNPGYHRFTDIQECLPTTFQTNHPISNILTFPSKWTKWVVAQQWLLYLPGRWTIVSSLVERVRRAINRRKPQGDSAYSSSCVMPHIENTLEHYHYYTDLQSFEESDGHQQETLRWCVE